MAVYIQYLVCTYVFIFVSCIISLGIGPFLLVTTITEDIEINAHDINECGINENTVTQTLEKLAAFIQSYLSAKQLSEYSEYLVPIVYFKTNKSHIQHALDWCTTF